MPSSDSAGGGPIALRSRSGRGFVGPVAWPGGRPGMLGAIGIQAPNDDVAVVENFGHLILRYSEQYEFERAHYFFGALLDSLLGPIADIGRGFSIGAQSECPGQLHRRRRDDNQQHLRHGPVHALKLWRKGGEHAPSTHPRPVGIS